MRSDGGFVVERADGTDCSSMLFINIFKECNNLLSVIIKCDPPCRAESGRRKVLLVVIVGVTSESSVALRLRALHHTANDSQFGTRSYELEDVR